MTKGADDGGKYPISFSGDATGAITIVVNNDNTWSFKKGTVADSNSIEIDPANIAKITLGTGQTFSATAELTNPIKVEGTGAALHVPDSADFSKLDISGFSSSTFVVTPAGGDQADLSDLTVGNFTGGAFVVTAGSVDFSTLPSFGSNANTLVINSPSSVDASLTGLDLSTFKGTVSLAGDANFAGLVLNSDEANSYEVIKSGNAKLLAEIPANFSNNVVVDVDGSGNIVVTENAGTPKSITLKTGANDTKFVWNGAAESVLTIDDALTGTLGTSATSGSVIVVGDNVANSVIDLAGFDDSNELASNVYVYTDSSHNTVDLSGVTFAEPYNKIVGIYGSEGDQTITGSSKNDFIHLEHGNPASHGNDTVKFAATAETNGHDVIRGFKAGDVDVANGGDVLDFSAFLGTAATGLTAVVEDSSTTSITITSGNILRVTDTGDALNATSIAALFGGGKAFAAPAENAKYVLLTDKGNIWYIANGNDTTISEGEVKLVGTIESPPDTGSLSLNTLIAENFGFTAAG